MSTLNVNLISIVSLGITVKTDGRLLRANSNWVSNGQWLAEACTAESCQLHPLLARMAKRFTNMAFVLQILQA